MWCVDDFKCKRTLKSAFVVRILLVSSEGRFIFCAGQIDGKKTKSGVVAVWHGHPDQEPIRLLGGFGKLVRSLHAPNDPGDEKQPNHTTTITRSTSATERKIVFDFDLLTPAALDECIFFTAVTVFLRTRSRNPHNKPRFRPANNVGYITGKILG